MLTRRTGAVRSFTERRTVRFAFGSGAGLALDLGVFALLALLGVAPFLANLTSTALAITTVYFLTTRFAFRAAPTWRTYVAFASWYAASALIVSTVIGLVGGGDDRTAFLTKLCSVPVTFSANYLFGRWLFTGGAERLHGGWLPTRLDGRQKATPERTVLRLMNRRSSRRRRMGIAAASTAVFTLLVLPINIAMSFLQPADRRAAVLSHLLQSAFVVALFGAVLVLLGLVQAVRLGSRRHRRWALFAVAYLLVNLVVLVLIYPGYWVWDEFYTLFYVKQFSTEGWQGYLTTVFYTFGLQLGPSPIVILLTQLAVISLVVGYVVSLLMERLTRPRLAVLAAVPLLSFPVLLNNQYPLRLTLYAYLLVLLVVRIGRLAPARRTEGPAIAGFLQVSGLIALLAFWRSEGVLLLALLPVAFVLAGLPRALHRTPGRVVAVAVLGVAMSAGIGGGTAATAMAGYQATAVINPLSTMLQGDLQGPRVDDDLRDIGAVLSLDIVRSHPSWVETPALWSGALRNGFSGTTAGLFPAFADLVVQNPGPFLDNRVRAFAAANSMQAGQLPQVQSLGVFQASSDVHGQVEGFAASNSAVAEWNPSLKYAIEQRLLLWSDDRQLLPLSSVVWNVTPQLIAALLVGLIAAVRRRWWWVLGSAVTLGNATLVFLTEPAAYFMYFFPAYLLGGALATGAVALALDQALLRTASRTSLSALDRSPALRTRPTVLLAIPAYNCERQITRVIDGIDGALLDRIDRIAVIDNRSTDGTAYAAEVAGARLGDVFQVWRNTENYGLGGSHKVAFEHAIEQGFDYIAVLHGDDQAHAGELHRLIDRAEETQPQAVLGARFIRGSKRVGYSAIRTGGNLVINAIFSVVAHHRTVDLGSGLNLFSVADLSTRPYADFDDGITFNIDLLLNYFRTDARLEYEPITWREEDQVSNARNLTVGRRALSKLWRWRTGRPAQPVPVRAYGYEVVA